MRCVQRFCDLFASLSVRVTRPVADPASNGAPQLPVPPPRPQEEVGAQLNFKAAATGAGSADGLRVDSVGSSVARRTRRRQVSVLLR